MLESVKLGAAANKNVNGENEEDENGMTMMMTKACSDKRAAKKKAKKMFSLQDLLSSDLDKAIPKVDNDKKVSKANSKQKKKGAKTDEVEAMGAKEDAEFEAFIKQQLEAKKRKKMAAKAPEPVPVMIDTKGEDEKSGSGKKSMPLLV